MSHHILTPGSSVPGPLSETILHPLKVTWGEEGKPSLPLYIDSSMLSSFRSCPRRFFWNYVRHKQPMGKSVHLIAGGAFAAGIEAARRHAFANPEAAHTDDLLTAAWPAFQSEWGNYEAPEGSPKNYLNVFYALERYLQEFHPLHDPVQPLAGPDGPTVEFSFAIPLRALHPSGEPFIFVGRFDLLGLYNSVPVIMDEKTTSALGQTWLNQWDLRGQFMGYCWATSQLGWHVNHVMVRGIALLKTDIKFASVLVQFNRTNFIRWEAQLYRTLAQILECYHSDLWDFNFADSCASYGGCPFVQLCQSADPEPWLSNYEDRTWNPLSRVPLKT